MKMIKKLLDNAYVFSVITRIISVVTGLGYTVLYSRYLGAELRGTAAVINNYTEMIMLVLCFGMYQAYPYFKKLSEENKYNEFINNVSGFFLIYCAIAAALIFIVRPSADVCVIMVLIPLSMGIKQFNYVVLIENPKIRNITQIVIELMDIAFLGALALFTKASYFYCILFLIVRAVFTFALAVQNLKVPIYKIRPTVRQSWKYIRYGFLPMVTLILMEINYKVDVIMLERMDISKADIGVYSLGVMIAQKLWLIPDALKDILTGKLASGKSEEEVSKITRISLWVTFICVLGMAAVGEPLIRLVFGAEYDGAYMVFINIALGVLGMVFYKMIYAYNVVNGHKNVNFVLLLIAAVSNVVLNYFLIKSMGINGAAIASTVSYCICGLGFLFYFVRTTEQSAKNLLLPTKGDFTQLKGFIRK